MKFYTLDKTILMDIASVEPHDQGVVIDGKIMATMPMRVILRPDQLRAGLKLVTPRLVWRIVRMLVQKSPV